MRHTTEELREKETEGEMSPLTKTSGHFEAVDTVIAGTAPN